MTVIIENNVIELERPDGLDDRQWDAVQGLAGVLELFRAQLLACHDSGLSPVDSFRAAGIEIPGMAAPLVNQMLKFD